MSTSNNSPEQSQLGKTSAYQTQYDPSLIFPIPRAEKRAEIGLKIVDGVAINLPFFGMDFWNAYEVSWLNLRGKPQVAILSVFAPAFLFAIGVSGYLIIKAYRNSSRRG